MDDQSNNKFTLGKTNSEEYLLFCLKMSLAEGLKKGFELIEWSAKMNKQYKEEIEKKLSNYFLLK